MSDGIEIELEHVSELQAIEAEIDKRLMPEGLEWPRFDDGKQITWNDAPEDVTAVCLALDGSCYSLHYDMPDDERMCICEASERVKRPEPEAIGAGVTKLPITVHDIRHCPLCKNDSFWVREHFNDDEELLRCAGCGNDYLWRRPTKEWQ